MAPDRPGAPALACGDRVLLLDRPRVMGVLNVTPDSFSDGGRFVSARGVDLGRIADTAASMISDGAAIIDIGGESTRPGAAPVPAEDELQRVIPVLERLASLDTILSVDTSKPEVAKAAIAAGAGMVNDVCAGRAEGMLAVVRAGGAALALMHMQGEPRTMQHAPCYADVVTEVCAFLSARLAACRAAGLDRDRLLVDPGFGFGKTLAHNLELLRGLGRLAALGAPVLVGLSRKRMIATLTGKEPVRERLPGSVAAAVLAAVNGASIIRAHDVAATVDALEVAHAFMEMD